MDAGGVAIFGAALVGFGIGFAARRWWTLPLLGIPTYLWFVLTVGSWGEEDSDGVTGADFFLMGFLLVGAPLLAGGLAGIALGRRVLPPPPRGITSP